MIPMLRKKRLYMDFAAATPLHPSVEKEMIRGLFLYGNPSGPHHEARAARAAIDEARTRIAKVLMVKPDDVMFTSGGTEGNNLALSGVLAYMVASGMDPRDMHVITSAFEHSSVERPLAHWSECGVRVSYVKPNADGVVTKEAVEALLSPETVLVSIMAVQSEIGQLQPLKDIARSIASYREKNTSIFNDRVPEARFPIFHSDASQSLLFVDLAPDRLGVDVATYDAQKNMGPKGAGVLYKKSWVPLAPLIRGGTQERGLRPGTENVAGILGMARAFEYAAAAREARVTRVSAVRNYCVTLLQKEIPEVEINGGFAERIANNIHVSIPGVDGDYLAVLMDQEGIAVSARSACIAAGTPSRTILSLGKTAEQATGTLRLSFAPWVTRREVRRMVRALKKSVALARGI
jgi:cysteine desulfurase